MIKYLIVLLFFVSCNSNNTPKGTTNSCFEKVKAKKCPQNSGNIILPNSYTPNAIFVGISPFGSHFKFLKKLIEITSTFKQRPKVNILIPQLDTLKSQQFLKDYFEHDHISFYQTTSNITMWAQDYFELITNTTTSEKMILDLPYRDVEGDLIPANLSLMCKKQMIDLPNFPEEQVFGSESYGGNIEPISDKIVLIGNNMAENFIDHLNRKIDQDLFKVNVSWLETGHVDELFTTIPGKDDNPCNRTLLYSSPRKAFELLSKLTPDEKDLMPKIPSMDDLEDDPNDKDNLEWPDFNECIKKNNLKSKKCQAFVSANMTYQKNIEKGIKNIQKVFKEHHKCQMKTISLPQLFSPLEIKSIYGVKSDKAIAFNENAVNSIVIYPHIIQPWQTIPHFKEYIEEKLVKLGMKVHFSNAEFAHRLTGGIHCATNISYTCEP